jgi:hypothetical protein
VWDGLDLEMNRSGPGVYFVVLRFGDVVRRRSVALD